MCYDQNFLSKVILRADFGTHPIALGAEVTKFSNGVAATFPHISSNLLMRVDFDVATEGTSAVKHTKAGTQWVHRKSPAGTAQVVLEPTFMALEYGPGDYQSFEAFLAEFTLLSNQLYDVFEEFPLDRIGLRYVNEIRLPGKALEWSGVIREELVSAVMASAVPDGRLLRSMHQVVEQHGDDQVLFNYGIFNPDFPAPAVQRFFILDIDCSRTGAVQRNEAIDCIKSLNNHSTVAFESSIGDELRKIMGVKK